MPNVLVTGGLGYIGRSTVALLESQGFTCVIVDQVSGDDTKNLLAMSKTFVKYRPVAVVHLAAKKSIGESIKHPVSYYYNNVLSTLIVSFLSWAFKTPIVFSSSAAVYEPTNPYAKAKKIEEQIIRRVPKNVILRYFNIGGQSNGSIDLRSVNIFGVINRAVTGKNTFTVNDPLSTRDYTHVEDIAKANLCAVVHLLKGGRPVLTDIYSGTQHTVPQILEQYATNGVEVLVLYGDIKDTTVYPTVKQTDAIGWASTQTFNEIIRSEVEGLKHELGAKGNL
jgi:UDP-glucose 4-epimerase